jgi:hypothetical protein
MTTHNHQINFEAAATLKNEPQKKTSASRKACGWEPIPSLTGHSTSASRNSLRCHSASVIFIKFVLRPRGACDGRHAGPTHTRDRPAARLPLNQRCTKSSYGQFRKRSRRSFRSGDILSEKQGHIHRHAGRKGILDCQPRALLRLLLMTSLMPKKSLTGSPGSSLRKITTVTAADSAYASNDISSSRRSRWGRRIEFSAPAELSAYA